MAAVGVGCSFVAPAGFGSHFVAVLFGFGMGFGHTPVVVVGLALFVVGIVGLFGFG